MASSTSPFEPPIAELSEVQHCQSLKCLNGLSTGFQVFGIFAVGGKEGEDMDTASDLLVCAADSVHKG